MYSDSVSPHPLWNKFDANVVETFGSPTSSIAGMIGVVRR